MQKTCKNCEQNFPIYQQDLDFYERIDVLPPTLCPTCRQQRRATFRNEQNLYHDTCDKTGKTLISMYRPELDAKVYAPEIWWSDQWNPTDYGKEFDFSKSFFVQFQELRQLVPRLPLYSKNVENSDFANHVENTKNAYLCADTALSEDTFYSKWIVNCNDLVDCYQLKNSDVCYQSLYSIGSNNGKYVDISDRAIDSDFIYNCQNVYNCIFCCNLVNKKYYIKNQPHSKDEYTDFLKNYDTGSYTKLQEYIQEFEDLKKHTIRKANEQISCEDCLGNYLFRCKNVQFSFGIVDSWDSRYCYDAGQLKDCLDTYESAFECELQYECHGCNRGKYLIGCSVCYDLSNSYYCEMCHNSSNLFGCIGLRHKQYCILNKQYTKEEYEKLIPKIIAHMKETQELGEFFPTTISHFAYNESAAMEFTPLTKEEVESKGWLWYAPQREYKNQTYQIPDHIKDVPDEITSEILACEKCNKNYKIISQELAFYRKHKVAIPHLCPSCRYLKRLEGRHPYILHKRQCQKCEAKIYTTYPPESPEIVYCENCYHKEIY